MISAVIKAIYLLSHRYFLYVKFKYSGQCCGVRLQGYSSPDSDLKKELRRKDALIARLIAESNIYALTDLC